MPLVRWLECSRNNSYGLGIVSIDYRIVILIANIKFIFLFVDITGKFITLINSKVGPAKF